MPNHAIGDFQREMLTVAGILAAVRDLQHAFVGAADARSWFSSVT